MEHDKKLLTVDDAVKFLDLKKNYIYKLIHLKKIPCYKPLNGRVYFKPDELEAFIFRNKQAAEYEVSHA
ncbi:MAG: helix-turn-helix domain-containing protein [Treponema sp.]|jgi:excisionase family DNA binding protein|nr:helix-turn-helix domain-containing protein [Treponema sp.]